VVINWLDDFWNVNNDGIRLELIESGQQFTSGEDIFIVIYRVGKEFTPIKMGSLIECKELIDNFNKFFKEEYPIEK
jgi:hypothetical protein